MNTPTTLLRIAASLLVVAGLSPAAGCPALPPEDAPLVIPPTGTIVGEVFVEDGGTRTSIGDALVEIYGTSARVTSQADRQWVLPGIRLGDHRVRISDPSGDRFVEVTAALQARNQTLILDAEDTTVRPAARISGRVVVDSPTAARVFLVGGSSLQTAAVGDDGTFVLGSLPAGEVQIAAAREGFSPVLRTLTVTPGENALGDDLVLAPTSLATLTLRGRVELDGRTDFSGVAVTLDNGLAVAVTDAAGDYEFTGLAPGGYALRATIPGFRSVSLPGVVVTEAGEVIGLVPVFLSAGQDDQVIEFPGEGEGEGEGEGPPPSIDIVFPGPNAAFPGGAPIVLAADVQNTAEAVTWSLADVLGDNAVPFTTTGATIVADLPIVSEETFFTIEASVAGVTAAVIVRIQPPVVATVEANAAVLGVGLPGSEPLVEGGVLVGERLRIQQGHPADLRPAEGLTAVWTSSSGAAFQDGLPVAELPPGTHRFTGVVTTVDGQQGNVIVEVVVSPLVFDVVIAEPADGVAYFVDTGLPLRATVSHGWQQSFLTNTVSWRLPTGTVVGTGLATAAQGLGAGPDVVTVEVVDLAGNRRVQTVPFALDAVVFTAFFNAPAADPVVQAGTPVRLNVGFDHNRLSDAERAAVTVQVLSDRDGLLTIGGTTSLAPNVDHLTSALSEGTHTLTARVFGGGRIAQAITRVTVQAKFVSSSLVQPVRDLVAIPGEAVAMSVAASGGNGAVPQVRWFMDGVEFPSTWPGYGADPAAVARRSLALGTFNPDAFPFNDVRPGGGLFWSDGPHVIEVSVAADDVDVGLGCVNLGTRAQCRAFNVQVARAVRVISTNLTVTAGQTEVWDGVVRLQAQVTINGGALVVLPGTRVLLDMRDPVTPSSQTGNSGNRRILLTVGELRVGDGGQVTPVVFETLKSFAVTNKWGGFLDNGAAANDRTVSFQNAVVRDAVTAIEFADVDLVSNSRAFVLRDVVVEDCDIGIVAECPTAMDDVTVRRLGSGRIGFDLRLRVACPPAVAYSGLTTSSVTFGMTLADAAIPTTVTLSDLDISAFSNGLNTQPDTSIELVDSRFTGVTTTFTGDAALDINGSDDVVLRRVAFENVTHAIVVDGTGVGSLDVRDSTFSSMSRALTIKALAATSTVALHGNLFEDVAFIGRYDAGNLDLVNMQGNFIGDFTASTAGRAVKATPAGTIPTVVAQVVDRTDALTSAAALGRFRLDNPLPSVARPHAVIREPNESEVWNTRQCIPFVALPLDDTFDVDANCAFRLGAPGAAVSGATPVTLDADGCLSSPTDGLFDVHLVCTAGLTTTTHSSRLRIDSTRFSGPIHPRGDTWSGTIVVDGDVVVPAGATLTVAPDAVVRFATGDRTLHERPIGTSTLAGSSRLRGSAIRSDVFVEGGIVAVDTDGAPISFIANAGTQRNTWSGFLLTAGSSLTLRGVQIDSTVATVTGDAATNAAAVPTMDLTNLRVSETSTIATGICPPLIDGLVVENALEVYICGASETSEVRNATLTNISLPNNAWFNIDDLPGSVTPGFTLRDVVGVGSPAARRDLININSGAGGRLELIDVAVENVDIVVETNAANQVIAIDGLDVFNFGTAFFMGDDETLTIANSRFELGSRVIEGSLGRTTMTRSRTVDVQVPFRDTSIAGTLQLDVTDSQFERADVVFDFSQGFAGAGASGFDLSGNNFLNTTTRVLRQVGSQANTVLTRFDLTGSHFGVVDRAGILALVEDIRTDSPVDPADDNIGRTSFAGFSATPLSLVVP